MAATEAVPPSNTGIPTGTSGCMAIRYDVATAAQPANTARVITKPT